MTSGIHRAACVSYSSVRPGQSLHKNSCKIASQPVIVHNLPNFGIGTVYGVSLNPSGCIISSAMTWQAHGAISLSVRISVILQPSEAHPAGALPRTAPLQQTLLDSKSAHASQ